MGSGDEIEELVRTSMDVESVGGPPAGGGTANLEETTIQQKIPNFEACIRDIDDAINSVPMITHLIDVISIHTLIRLERICSPTATHLYF